MRRVLVILVASLFFAQNIYSEELPRVTILATGGTIAGSASSSTAASYQPGVLNIDQIIASVPNLKNVASLRGIQVANIASQNMTLEVWLKLHSIIDSLFVNDLTDGVVITHGTDTMEETAYFLNLTVRHPRPVVLVGAMRPATSLSADGPMNLYNAVALAANKEALEKGVMVVMNDYILSAEDVTKNHTINTASFIEPNFGYYGIMRDSKPVFFRKLMKSHTYLSPFNISKSTKFPEVEIIYSYAFSSEKPLTCLIDSGVKGVVVAGVGHGNYNEAVAKELKRAVNQGVAVVRSARIQTGGVDESAEEYTSDMIVSYIKSPQKARILLMLALTQTNDPQEIQRYFGEL